MTYDPNNIFAKILRGEIPCHRIYEDDQTLAFMDVMPMTDGHCLVIPKAASRNLLDADPAILAPLMATTQKISRATMKAFDADGIQIRQYNEQSAGQTVFHLHFHIIPVKFDIGLQPHTGQMADHTTLAGHAARIVKNL